MITTRGVLAASTAIGLALLTTPAAVQAQEAPAAERSTDIAEIVVVAQRRSERLQDVPLSVTAIQGDDLISAGVGKSSELAIVTPGLQMTNTGVYVQPVIRGVGSALTSPSAEANVATYVDGAYQMSLVGAIFDLPDVESIQVLKGPQGTLFGRNATGGAILINTKAPNLTELEGTVSAGVGNYGALVTKGFVSAPIIQDKIAFSLTGLYDHTDGWKRSALPGSTDEAGAESYLLRGKLRFLPWEGADFTLTALYSRRDDDGVSKASSYLGNNSRRGTGPVPAAVIASEPWTYASDAPMTLRKQQTSLNLSGDIEFGPGKISTTTYFDRSPSRIWTDLDQTSAQGGTAKLFSQARTYSQELLYTTDQLGRFRGTVGGFYFNSRVQNGVLIFLPVMAGPVQSIYGLDKVRAFAGFGEVTFDVTDQFSVTGGVRYSNERRHSNAIIGAGATASVTRPDISTWFFSPPRPELKKTWTAWTPRLSAIYKVTPRTNVYATFSKGFSSGVFNASSNQTTPINPEKVKSYEIGIKSNEIRNFSFNVAAFYTDYTDLQTTFLVFVGALPSQQQGNAAKARIKGVEVNGQWRATPNFEITAGATYLSPEYTRYPQAPVYVPNVAPTGLNGNRATVLDISGNQMIRTPKFSGNLTARYHYEFAQGELDAAATVYHASKTFWEYGNRIVQPSYTTFQGNISYRPEGTNARVTVWGKNLSNEKVISSGNISGSYDSLDYLPPRTYGVTVQYDF